MTIKKIKIRLECSSKEKKRKQTNAAKRAWWYYPKRRFVESNILKMLANRIYLLHYLNKDNNSLSAQQNGQAKCSWQSEQISKQILLNEDPEKDRLNDIKQNYIQINVILIGDCDGVNNYDKKDEWRITC